MTGKGAIPWGAWMALGLGRLRLSPDVFWRLSIAEWRAITGDNVEPPMTQADLNQLMTEYPDAE